MQHNNSFEFFVSEFEQLIQTLRKTKRDRLIFGLLSLIGGAVFYLRGLIWEFDLINAISIIVVGKYILSMISFLVAEKKIKNEAADFVKLGLFDICTDEQKIEYNGYVAKINELCK
jgi:hypothetical protein